MLRCSIVLESPAGTGTRSLGLESNLAMVAALKYPNPSADMVGKIWMSFTTAVHISNKH